MNEVIVRRWSDNYVGYNRDRRRLRKESLVRILGAKCQDCGESFDPSVFDFHHPNSDKEFNLSRGLSGSWTKLLAEAQKCVLLCANCHRIRHVR